MKNFIKHRLLAPEGEISSSDAPEVKSNNAALYEKGDINESFDDLEYESEASKKAGEEYKSRFKDKIAKAKANSKAKEESDDEDEPVKTPKKEEKPKEKKNEINTLSDKSDDEEVEDEKEVEKKPEAKKEETDEEKELSKETKGKIKVRMGGELYGLEPDSLVRYKVDGQMVEAPLQDIINKASGVEALDKKFTEYGEKNKVLEKEKAQVGAQREFLMSTMHEIVGIIKDPTKNPFDALNFIVEKTGEDPYTLWRRSLESSLDEIEKLQGMNEDQRKAYFLEKKDEFRTKADENRRKAYEEHETRNKVVSEADAIRQAHGVSEEQFMEAWDALEAEGVKNPTDKDIVERASITPHLSTVQDILEPFEDQIDDAKYSKVVTDFARQIRAKELTPEQLKELVAAEFVDEDVKDLTVRKKAVTEKKSKEVEAPVTGKKGYDSFDDFE